MKLDAEGLPRGGVRRPDGAPVMRIVCEAETWRMAEFVCTAGAADRPFEERHDWVSFAAVVEGSFKYRADTGTVFLHPGAIMLGNYSTCYECGHAHSTGDRCIAIQVSPEYFSEVAASQAGSARFKFPVAMLASVPEILPWFARIEGLSMRSEPIGIDEAVSRFVETVTGFLSGASQRPLTLQARDERRISNVMRHIERHAAETLDLNALAGVASFSKYHFLRTFRQAAGMTPYQYILGLRLRRAAVRLSTSLEPVSMIALETGFGDLSTFNGRFRDVFGVTPTAYRGRERTVRI